MWKKAGGEMRNILRLKCELTTVKYRRIIRQTSLAPIYCRIKAFKQQNGTMGFYPFINLSFSCKHLQPARGMPDPSKKVQQASDSLWYLMRKAQLHARYCK